MKTIFGTALIGFPCTLLLACTADVGDPVVHQTALTDESCVKNCEDQHFLCVGKCTAESWRAACESARISCSGACTGKDGGG
jgi:hypothetical protein